MLCYNGIASLSFTKSSSAALKMKEPVTAVIILVRERGRIHGTLVLVLAPTFL
jgi:hypothetical protein